jgi:hypothetical protein
VTGSEAVRPAAMEGQGEVQPQLAGAGGRAVSGVADAGTGGAGSLFAKRAAADCDWRLWVVAGT